MFSPGHLVALAVAALAVVAILAGRKRWHTHPRLGRAARALAAVLLACEAVLQLWYIATGEWGAAYSLPLQLCSATLLLSAVMLWTASYRLFECLYFAGIGGALQALLTPNLDYAFPHLIYFHFFIAHIGIVAASLLMIAGYGYRPTLGSIGRTMLYLNAYALLVFIINRLLGSNYMFLARKPSTASMLDYLGEWPWYILTMELAALAIFLLLFIPFLAVRRKPTN